MCTGDPRSQELGRKLQNMKKGTGSEQDLRGRQKQKQKQRSGVRVMGVGSLPPRGRGSGLVFE